MPIPDGQMERVTALMVRARKLGFAALSADEQVVFHVMNFDTEMAMSGFEGFLQTHHGDWAIQTIDALKRIGTDKSAELLRAACQFFPKGLPPSDTAARRNLMSAFTEKQLEMLQRLDAEYALRPDGLFKPSVLPSFARLARRDF